MYVCRSCGNFLNFRTTSFVTVNLITTENLQVQNEVETDDMDYEAIICSECSSDDIIWVHPESIEEDIRHENDTESSNELIKMIKEFAEAQGVEDPFVVSARLRRRTDNKKSIDVNSPISYWDE